MKKDHSLQVLLIMSTLNILFSTCYFLGYNMVFVLFFNLSGEVIKMIMITAVVTKKSLKYITEGVMGHMQVQVH